MSRPIINDQGNIREMNDEEFAQYQIDVVHHEKQAAEELAKEEAKKSAESKLEALGLTSEEIAAFRG